MDVGSFPVLQEQEGNWTSSRTVRVAGVRIVQFHTENPAKLSDAILKFQTSNDDVFIASFPKSGMVHFLYSGLVKVYCSSLLDHVLCRSTADYVLRARERGKPDHSEKNPSEQGRQLANSPNA